MTNLGTLDRLRDAPSAGLGHGPGLGEQVEAVGLGGELSRDTE